MVSRPGAGWQELPIHFKQGLVATLDFRSRCSLRRCSKTDRELVDSLPLVFDRISLTFPEPERLQKRPTIPIQKIEEPDSLWSSFLRYVLCNPKPKLPPKVELEEPSQSILSIRNRVDEAKRVFCEPKEAVHAVRCVFEALRRHEQSSVDSFEFSPDAAISVLIAMAQNARITFKTRKLECRWSENSLDYLKCFDSRVLEELVVSDGPDSEDQVRRLVATEQWSNLKSIVIRGGDVPVEIPLEHFSRAERIRVDVGELSSEHFEFINEFRRRNLPSGSFFEFVSRTRIRLEDVESLGGWSESESESRENSLIVSMTRSRIKVFVEKSGGLP